MNPNSKHTPSPASRDSHPKSQELRHRSAPVIFSLPTPEAEPSLMPILLALMTRTLSTVTKRVPTPDINDPEAVRKLIAVADEALLAQMMELACVPFAKRQRYWRCLLQAQQGEGPADDDSFPHFPQS